MEWAGWVFIAMEGDKPSPWICKRYGRQRGWIRLSCRRTSETPMAVRDDHVAESQNITASTAFRKYVTSYFGICSTAMGAVRRACLCRMAKLTYHGLTKRCTIVPDSKE
jgi:uncharacterized protein (UPF0262 family)